MSTELPPRTRGRVLLLVGLALGPLGIAAFMIQLRLQRLAVPWYMPALAFLGVLLVAASLRMRRTVWRVLAVVFLVGLGGFELVALNALTLPRYTGPVAVGTTFPPFEAKLADGTPFDQSGLTGEKDTAMVFFRGRW